MFLKRQFITIALVLSLSSQNTFAMEKEFPQELNLFPAINTMLPLVAVFVWVFGDRFDVRTQIRDNLAVTELGQHVSQELYQHPVLCIGTGRCRWALDRFARKTVVLNTDRCIDISKNIEPDYICDGWEIGEEENQIEPLSFGFVFFAHAGHHPSFNKPEQLQRALQTYFNLLMPNGVFVFNSEVFIRSDAPDQLALKHSYNSFEEWKEAWINAFASAGFQQIEVIVKAEPTWGPGFVTILLVARKI